MATVIGDSTVSMLDGAVVGLPAFARRSFTNSLSQTRARSIRSDRRVHRLCVMNATSRRGHDDRDLLSLCQRFTQMGADELLSQMGPRPMRWKRWRERFVSFRVLRGSNRICLRSLRSISLFQRRSYWSAFLRCDAGNHAMHTERRWSVFTSGCRTPAAR